jgi:oxygen-dependent protoporphyrinogen oxidase
MPGVLGFIFRRMMKSTAGWSPRGGVALPGDTSITDRVTFSLGSADCDISIADWFRALSGSSAVGDNMISAMIHGIYGGDIDKLSALSVFDEMFNKESVRRTLPSRLSNAGFIQPDHEAAFVREMVLHNDTTIRKSWSVRGVMLTMGKHGMEAIPQGLEAALRSAPNVEFKMGEPVEKLSYNKTVEKVIVSLWGLAREVLLSKL